MRFVAGIAFVVLALPLFANAATIADLQAQIATLLNQIHTLQQQFGYKPVTNTAGNTIGVTNAGACPQLGRSLSLAATGNDVSQLQQFLASDPSVYPEGKVTGYYGALTQA